MAESTIKRGDRYSIFHQLDSIGFAVQNDGRFQISGQSGNTRRVITFGENGVLSESKTTDDGNTFSTLWENNNIIPAGIASIGDYTNAKLLQALRDSNKIISGKIHAFSVMATGGSRIGLCYLYGDTKQYGWIMVGHYNYMPIFLTVNNGVAVENPFTADRHIMHDFNVNIAASESTSGQKTFDITIPSGYRLASGRIYGSYVSGQASVKANDKSATFIRDGVVRLSIFLYNPNNVSANLVFAGAVYLEKVA